MDYKKKMELSNTLLSEIFETVLANYDSRVETGVTRYKDFPLPKEVATTHDLARYYQRMGLKYNDIMIESPANLKIYEQYPDEIQEIFNSPVFQSYLQWGINTDILNAILEKR